MFSHDPIARRPVRPALFFSDVDTPHPLAASFVTAVSEAVNACFPSTARRMTSLAVYDNGRNGAHVMLIVVHAPFATEQFVGRAWLSYLANPIEIVEMCNALASHVARMVRDRLNGTHDGHECGGK